MRIAISGYGRMGKMIEEEIRKSGDHEISLIHDPFSDDSRVLRKLTPEDLRNSDAVIDFTSPEAVPGNIEIYKEAGIPAVIGTTGWLDRLPQITNENSWRMIYSGNFSMGVSAMLMLIKRAGEIFSSLPSYDAAIREVHHRAKKDAPSGTALMIADALMSKLQRKKTIVQHIPEHNEELLISSERVGYVPGIHSVIFDSPADTIEITHTARSREGFASGAVKAAEWIVNQENGIYTMDDFISSLSGGENA